MPDRFRQWLLRVLRVPAEPAPPPGDPRRVRTFRAAPSYFRYKVMVWALKQFSALGGLVLSYLIFRSAVPAPVFGYIGIFERLALAAFVAQLPFSYAVLKLDFEMRWYILSDRSLRIRTGILSVREHTTTFANIQNITIRQNPLQRLFGISTVVVRAAGGGGSSSQSNGGSSHEARFEGVADAEHIRTVIRDRVRLHRDSGLGDPDEPPPVRSAQAVPAAVPAAAPASLRPAVAAAHRILAEAAGLRAAVVRRGVRHS
jgi:membrane protein YdbS with pleckstrin-like domain